MADVIVAHMPTPGTSKCTRRDWTLQGSANIVDCMQPASIAAVVDQMIPPKLLFSSSAAAAMGAFCYFLQFGWNSFVIGGLEAYALVACAFAVRNSPIYFTSVKIGECDRCVRVDPVGRTFGEDWGEGYGYSVAREHGRVVYRTHVLFGLRAEPATADYVDAYERLFPLG